VIDTLVNAKELHPGKRNSLDALCDRYGVSNAHRKLHGALLDSELLADVYLSMTRGQNMLSMDFSAGVTKRKTPPIMHVIAAMQSQ
jgi:DNA polymerase-3 subunit epsilon